MIKWPKSKVLNSENVPKFAGVCLSVRTVPEGADLDELVTQ